MYLLIKGEFIPYEKDESEYICISEDADKLKEHVFSIDHETRGRHWFGVYGELDYTSKQGLTISYEIVEVDTI